MPQICPRCSYIRKDTDTCPEWQCPSCQVAYIKANEPRPLPRASQHTTPQIMSDHESISAKTWLMLALLIVIAGFAWNYQHKHRHKTLPNNAIQQSTQPIVILYSASWCGYCKAARHFFIANGIQFTELDVETTTEGREGHKNLGGGGVPVIVVGDEVMHGYSEQGLEELLGSWLTNKSN